MKLKKTLKSERPVVENSARAKKRATRIRSKGGVLALDLDGNRVHAALAEYSGMKGRLQKVGTEDLGMDVVPGKTDARQVGTAIAAALAKRKIKGSQVLFVLPRSQVVLRPLTVPFVPDLGELSAMVHLQMAKDLPFKLEEGVVDFKVLRILEPGGDVVSDQEPASEFRKPDGKVLDGATGNTAGTGPTLAGSNPSDSRLDKAKGTGSESELTAETPLRRVEVMVGAVKRELCAYYQSVAEAAGMKLAGLVLRSHGGARLLIRMHPQTEDSATALILLRHDEITIDVIVGSMLVFSRLAMLRTPGQPTARDAASTAEQGKATNPIDAAEGAAEGEMGSGGVGAAENTKPAEANASGQPADAQARDVENPGEFLGVNRAEDGEPVSLVPKDPKQLETRFLTSLGTELLRSSASYDGMMWRRPLRAVHVGGDTGWEDRVAAYLAQKTGLPCTVLNPSDALELRRPEDSANLRGALVAVGGAFYYEEPAGPPLDFLHPKRPPVHRDTKHLKMFGTAAAVLLVLISLVMTRRHMVQQRVLTKQEIQAQVTEAEKKLPVYRRLQSQSRVVRSWMEGSQSWMSHLGLLSGILPGAEDLYLTSFTTTSQGLIRMSVQARSSDLLVDLDKRLRAAGYDVKPLSITPGNDRHGYPFRTTVELAVPKSMKIDLKEVQVPNRPEDDTPVTLNYPVVRRQS
jgi:Tfp pilus assembly PilM family ATPase